MFGEWTETDRLPLLITGYQPCGKRRLGRNLKRPSQSKTNKMQRVTIYLFL